MPDTQPTKSNGESKTQAKPAAAAAAPRKVRFNVGTQYQVLDVVGEGAYGIVCSAVHKASGKKVAIKKITPFEHSMFCLRTLRELKLLKFLSECGVSENIITVLDIVKPSSYESFKEVYLIQELMETDMHRVIRTQDLSDDHAQYFVYQTLRALKALHSADVIHRDLKPSNLLLNANCDLKVADFGLARSVKTAEPSGGETGFMTEYVATRWYRAPEIMLTFKKYTKPLTDKVVFRQLTSGLWACILAEMLSGKPLFPGRDYHHQLTLILDVLGTPTLDEFYAITTRRSRDYIRALPFRKKRPFATLFPNCHSLGCGLLNKDSPEEALAHPYLEAYHDPDDEPVAPPLDPEFFEFDLHKDDISREQLKELLYEEIMSFQPLPMVP
ncbi:mitogen-activated protein kinase [Flagelloscypha sp. PMI_526]|nr:mitogen-activated protein kinase [Flagelloscypha sp. PMI_526]